MKKIFEFLFGRKQPRITEVAVDGTSQSNILNIHMIASRMTHGQTNLVDLSPVRVAKSEGELPVIRFCPLQRIVLVEELGKGDGGAIPCDVVSMGLKIPENLIDAGELTLRNVLLSSNGSMQVIATKDTKWELAEQE